MIRFKGAHVEQAIPSKNRDSSILRDVSSGHHRFDGFTPTSGAIGNL
jgi:hypothetical protein